MIDGLVYTPTQCPTFGQVSTRNMSWQALQPLSYTLDSWRTALAYPGRGAGTRCGRGAFNNVGFPSPYDRAAFSLTRNALYSGVCELESPTLVSVGDLALRYAFKPQCSGSQRSPGR